MNHRSLKIRRMKALIKKEMFQIIRDPSSFLISVFLPILLLFLYGYGISFDLKHIKIAVVLEDSSSLSESFLTSLKDSVYFDVDIKRERESAANLLTEGAIKAIVVIPSYFSEKFYNKDEKTAIQVIADGSEPNTATFVQNYIALALENWQDQIKISEGIKPYKIISITPRFWYNPSLESRNFLIPGSLAIILTLIGTLLTSLVVAREWERGTMESLISTPVTIREVVIAKLVSYFILGILSFFMSVTLALIVYDIPLQASFFSLGCVAGVFLLTALGMGLLISSLAKNQFAASQGAIIAAFLPSFFLSGFIYEISSMPKFIQIMTNFISAKYFVSSLLSLFLVGIVPRLLFYNIVMMLLIAAAFFLATTKIIVKRLD